MAGVPVEERFALQDLMTDYCYAVDKLTDVEALLGLFTDDAVLDFRRSGCRSCTARTSSASFTTVCSPT